jgi:hypothetical protein
MPARPSTLFAEVNGLLIGSHLSELGALQRSFDDLRNSRLIFDDQKTHAIASLENRLTPVASHTCAV